jgi:hypothetical protein
MTVTSWPARTQARACSWTRFELRQDPGREIAEGRFGGLYLPAQDRNREAHQGAVGALPGGAVEEEGHDLAPVIGDDATS